MKIDEIIEVFYMSRKKNRENAKTLEELAKGAEKLSQQFKQSIYNRLKEIMEAKKKKEVNTITITERLRKLDYMAGYNRAITKCLETIGKELGIEK